MKTLNLHCDFIKFKGLKKALKKVDDIAPNQELEGSVDECLVSMIAVESGDSIATVSELVKNIKDIAGQVKAENIVLYPYAHLSRDLGKPEVAVEVLAEAAKELKKDFSVTSAPFGYYKSFELKVKGHPLSELSREIVSEGGVVKGDEAKDLDSKEIKKLLHSISKSVLDTSKLKDNDHRIIGKKMDLWSFNEVAPGMVFWHDKGLYLKNKLIELWREMHKNAGYEEISTPQIMDRKLWEISGHWSKFKENMFTTDYEKKELAIKPMNCPGGMLVYKTSPKSYKDLPLRVGELGLVHRIELSGVLGGLMRVIQFTQDDAHIFCTKKTLKDEISKIIDLTSTLYDNFNIKIDHIELSTRPPKKIGSEEIWDLAEKALEDVLKKKGIKYIVNKGDGAFYGPKIDFHIKDSLERTWQTSTIQLDMALPERFELEYTDEKGNSQQPIMLHRTIYGSLERFLGVYTEHVNGKFPLWISPNQIKVLTLNDGVEDYAKEVYNKFFETGFRVELDARNESMGKKAREASIQRFNYLVTVGDKEKADGKIAVKVRDGKEIKTYDLDEFLKELKKAIESKK